jgi:hypothetical protein
LIRGRIVGTSAAQTAILNGPPARHRGRESLGGLQAREPGFDLARSIRRVRAILRLDNVTDFLRMRIA